MNRRRLLRAGGPLALAGLAGCIGGQPADTPTGTPDGPETPPAPLTVTGTRCGQQVNRATVAFDRGTVTVEGTTWGNDACYTARLGGVTREDDALTVQVEAVSTAGGDEGCAQCITELDYRATVEVGQPPTEVVVVHRGERVTTARP